MPSTLPAPLNGITVIDQTEALAGPYCSMILGDLGADVIKIERPGVGDQSRKWGPPFIEGESAYYLGVNRNKRSLTLNFAMTEGQEIVHRLAERADVFLTNVPRESSMKKYNIDYETLRQHNEKLIYATISGYGHTGPRAGQPGYDIIAQGESGTMALTGEPDGGPMRFPTPMADMSAGLFAVIGILAALQQRHQTGEGAFIDVSLLESQMTWLANYAAEYFATGEEPPRRGNSHPQVVPYQPVQGRDGEWFILGAGSDNIWRKFCDLAGLEALRDDPRFYTNAERVRNRDELLPLVREAIRQRPTSEWLNLLREAGIPSGPIRNVGGALSGPQIAERGFVVELEHPALGPLKSLATPIHLAAGGPSYRRYPPRLGEHTADLLQELGYEADAVEELREAGVV
ncbi:MAG: CaiB/BaiF CoA-transferase family protein [Candidatus Promineifilaceae bacterium]|nr:CaiB/BaiF CoA-transferase family protein [Candidatus Promineifilaceae bacterium]